MEPEGASRRLAAIMFTDIVGYTALMAEVRLRRGCAMPDCAIRDASFSARKTLHLAGATRAKG